MFWCFWSLLYFTAYSKYRNLTFLSLYETEETLKQWFFQIWVNWARSIKPLICTKNVHKFHTHMHNARALQCHNDAVLWSHVYGKKQYTVFMGFVLFHVLFCFLIFTDVPRFFSIPFTGKSWNCQTYLLCSFVWRHCVFGLKNKSVLLCVLKCFATPVPVSVLSCAIFKAKNSRLLQVVL